MNPDTTIEVHEGPDSFGRYLYTLRWHDPSKLWCAVCGRARQLGCEHLGTPEYGRCAQVFRAPLPPGARRHA